jgi:LacI family transcriptional regulator
VTTILDVAKLADVSIATVSRVLNDDPAVRPRTRRVVLAAIEQLDYHPNAAARSLRLARSQTLGLVMRDLANPIYIEVLHGIEEVVRANGFALFLCDGGDDSAIEDLHLERLYERRVDGVILYSIGEPAPALARFQAQKTPVVAMGPAANRSNIPAVLVNERPATVAAVRRLLELGHTRIALVNKDSPPGRFVYRSEPIRREMADAGLTLDPALVVDAHTGEECRQAMHALLALPDPPTAIVVATHFLTPYVLQGIHAAGLGVPEDISLVAYGDSAWTAAYQPAITVVRVDYETWGRETAALLLRLIVAPEEPIERLTLEAQFIERASLAPAPVRSTAAR